MQSLGLLKMLRYHAKTLFAGERLVRLCVTSLTLLGGVKIRNLPAPTTNPYAKRYHFTSTVPFGFPIRLSRRAVVVSWNPVCEGSTAFKASGTIRS